MNTEPKSEEYRKGWIECQEGLLKSFNNQLAAGKNLRDEFAMAAMQGLVGHFFNMGENYISKEAIEVLSKGSYLVSDAMLSARKASVPTDNQAGCA